MSSPPSCGSLSPMASIQNRMLRAAKLEVDLYEEVEADTGATMQATGVVVISALAAGIGTTGTEGAAGFVVGTVIALATWYVWAYLTYWIGTRLLPEPETKADHGELLRTMGFAAAPGVIRVVGIIPGMLAISFLVSGIWMLVATVIAVRQALDYTSTLRAIGACLIGWVLTMIIAVSVVSVLS